MDSIIITQQPVFKNDQMMKELIERVREVELVSSWH